MASSRSADPGGVLIRRATRVAVVLPLVVGASSWLPDDPLPGLPTTYAVFGSFALLVFADFGGPMRRRFRAYVATTAVGAVLLVVGTLAATWHPLPVAAAFLVGWAVSFSAVLRGYVAAAGPAVQLVFVLAVTLGPPPSAIPEQLAGWLLGAVFATAAALVLWPARRRSELRTSIGGSLRDAGALVRSRWAEGDEDPKAALDALVASSEAVVDQYGGTPFRPAGASARDRALMSLVDEVQRLRTFLVWAVRDRKTPMRHGEGTPGDASLGAATATLLERSAATVVDGPPAGDRLSGRDIDAFVGARAAHLEASARWVEQQARNGRADDEVVRALGRAYALRVASFLSAMAAVDAVTSQGDRHDDVLVRHSATSLWDVVREQFALSSPWMRNALRAGAGVALAVLVALVTDVQHGFWVVLGVMSVLRFDALGTGRSALQAMVGTVAGFAVGSAVVVVAHDDLVVLWLLLPVTAFLAAWAPGRLGFPVGQASFTVFVIVLFGLVAYPPNLVTGLVRIEDVALGAAVSIVVGLLFWPRGVVPLLRRSTAEAFRAAADYLDAALRSVAGVADGDVAASRRAAADRSARASETFELAMGQRGPGLPHVAEWLRQTGAVAHVVVVADLVVAIGALHPTVSTGPEFGPAMADEARGVFDALHRVADTLESGAVGPSRTGAPGEAGVRGSDPDGDGVPRDVDEPATDAASPADPYGHGLLHCAVSCLQRLGHDGIDGVSVAVVVWVHDWLTHLDWVAGRAQRRAEVLAADGARVRLGASRSTGSDEVAPSQDHAG